MRKIKSTRISPMSGELSMSPFKSKTPSYDTMLESTNVVRQNTTIVPNKSSPTSCECSKDGSDEWKDQFDALAGVYPTSGTHGNQFPEDCNSTRQVEYSVYVEKADPAGTLLLQVISERIMHKKSTIFSLGGEIVPLSILVNGEYIGDLDERDLIDIGELSPGDILQIVATGQITSPTTILLEFETIHE